MKEIKRLLSFTRRAVDDYNMIEEGDRIGVGISGGKDSLTLLYTLAELRRFYPKQFTLEAITIDMGFEGMDFSPVAELCRELDVEYTIVPTQIANIIFNVRKESTLARFARECAAARFTTRQRREALTRSRSGIILTMRWRPLC